MKVRLPYHAGTFYAGSANNLKKQIEECFLNRNSIGALPKVNKTGPRNIISLINPHAGYTFSGPVAAWGYYNLSRDGRPESIVILGPNHTGFGSGVSTMIKGVWRTPLGDVEIDTSIAEKIQRVSKIIDIDDTSHRYEHSIEVQIPFLQHIFGSTFKIIPICMMMQDLQTSKDVGLAIAEATFKKNVLIIASTDMTHYEPHKNAEVKDKLAIEAILKLDEQLLQSTIELNKISMCGYGPTSAAIFASKKLGAAKAQLLCYKTSGDITGDQTHVVGYASISITK